MSLGPFEVGEGELVPWLCVLGISREVIAETRSEQQQRWWMFLERKEEKEETKKE